MSSAPTKPLVIVDGTRTPFSKAGTNLLTKTGIDPELIDHTILGCVCQPADSANIARVVALRAGIPKSKPAITVHRNCASGFESMTTAFEKAQAGHGEVFVVGGTESMSQVPFYYSLIAAAKFTALSRARTIGQKAKAMSNFRPKDFAPIIGLQLGLSDPVSGLNMGQTAEVLAREFGISREAQDAFALSSHLKGAAGAEIRNQEISPVYPENGKPAFIKSDNGVREQQTMEALAKLRPVFEKKHGTVTAGNASQITDGAVALLVMTEERAEQLGMKPIGRLIDYHYSGCDPARMGLGPAFSIGELKKSTGLKPEDADVIEINEAFAAQVLAVLQCLESESFAKNLDLTETIGAVPMDRLNALGGAIALGHPVGASGARLILTALNQLKQEGGKKALVSLCVGGGQGGAIWLERL